MNIAEEREMQRGLLLTLSSRCNDLEWVDHALVVIVWHKPTQLCARNEEDGRALAAHFLKLKVCKRTHTRRRARPTRHSDSRGGRMVFVRTCLKAMRSTSSSVICSSYQNPLDLNEALSAMLSPHRSLKNCLHDTLAQGSV